PSTLPDGPLRLELRDAQPAIPGREPTAAAPGPAGRSNGVAGDVDADRATAGEGVGSTGRAEDAGTTVVGGGRGVSSAADEGAEASGRAASGVSLDLPPGKRVAIVGASGAGKTMLLSMLVRFTGIARGQVRLGSAPLAELRGDDVRGVIGGMLSDAHVFNTTVKDNLLVAGPEATDGRLREVLTRAGLAELDLSIMVGEDGRSLSGGQRQRLLLARALLGGHQVLLLDEPTEHLDPATAEAVMTDLLTATDGRSLILVTHHLGHMDAFDEILVLDAGTVVQRGTHAELMEIAGPYREVAGTFAYLTATTRS
ncbi:MAG: ATP-binding cassette domain-containing protein, partial [Stackebrandtia sp.]